jgi:hypothetical protein
MRGKICHSISLVAVAFNFPVLILMLSLACNRYVKHFLLFWSLSIDKCVFGDRIVFYFECSESDGLVVLKCQWNSCVALGVKGWNKCS